MLPLVLYACLLAEGCNLGLSAISRATQLDYYTLARYRDNFIRQETLQAASTLIINQHLKLPLSQVWGTGLLSSSDGQRFPMTKKGKTLTARYHPRYFGLLKGLTVLSWTSDQLTQFGSKAVPTTAREATYTLDLLLDNETELPLGQHTTDTAGYTDLLFDAAYC